MNLAFAVPAVAVAAACGRPASALITRFSGPLTGAGRRSTLLTALLMAAVLAALVLVVAARTHQLLVASAVCWLVLLGVPLAAIDIRVRRLPDALTLTCFAGLALPLTVAAAMAGEWADLARAGAGGAIVAASFALLHLATPGSVGLGDAKFGLSTGAIAAWAGWSVLVTSVFAAFALAACYGIALLLAGRASLRSSLAFGPFLLAGCLATVLLAGR